MVGSHLDIDLLPSTTSQPPSPDRHFASHPFGVKLSSAHRENMGSNSHRQTTTTSSTFETAQVTVEFGIARSVIAMTIAGFFDSMLRAFKARRKYFDKTTTQF